MTVTKRESFLAPSVLDITAWSKARRAAKAAAAQPAPNDKADTVRRIDDEPAEEVVEDEPDEEDEGESDDDLMDESAED